MKKTKLLTALTVSASALLIGGSTLAATIPPEETTGTVTFEVDNGPGSIIEPDPDDGEDVIIKLPDTEGSTGVGALRIQFVPNFRFGTYNGIVAHAVQRPAELLLTEDETGAPRNQKIAPFVQVTDGRGLGPTEKSNWTLSAYASKFADIDGNDLGLSNISLEGSTLTTTMGDTAKANQMVVGHTLGTSISLDKDLPTLIMETKTGQTTNGYQVSNVFHSGYTKGMTYPAINGAADSTNGVKFNKVENISPIKDVLYTSNITWTLTDGL